jgi:hypothetical protein
MTSDELNERLRLLNETAPQLEHETERLARRLPIARATLEKIAEGQWAPAALKTARVALDTLETLDGLDILKIFYGKMSVGNLQLRYEHSLAERKMAIARSALETIANEETDSGVREIARETLDGFSVLSDGEQFKGFFLGAQQGDAILKLIRSSYSDFMET